jgi:hypothetical protein
MRALACTKWFQLQILTQALHAVEDKPRLTAEAPQKEVALTRSIIMTFHDRFGRPSFLAYQCWPGPGKYILEILTGYHKGTQPEQFLYKL